MSIFNFFYLHLLPNKTPNFKQMSEQKNACPSTNLAWAILCTAGCCVPFGIVSIIKATSVEKLWSQGKHEEALKASKEAKRYAIIGVIAGVTIYISYILFKMIVALLGLLGLGIGLTLYSL